MYEEHISDRLERGIGEILRIFSQGHPGEAQRRILTLIREARSDEERYFTLLYCGGMLTGIGRWEEAGEYLIQSAQMAWKHQNASWLARSHEKLGDLAAGEENLFGALHQYRYAKRNAAPSLDGSLLERLDAKIESLQSRLYSNVLSQDRSIIPLPGEYLSGNMAISFVHRDIFLKNYFARCLECNFCHDWCCSFGADIDIQNVERIEQHREGILPFIRPSEVGWFEEEYTYYEEYAGNHYTRINPQGPRCVFISKDQRGCGLHRYAIHQQIDYHEIKPLICILFPLSFAEGILSLAEELDDNSLVCSGPGDSAYRALRSELQHYFGQELTEELDQIERSVLNGSPVGK